MEPLEEWRERRDHLEHRHRYKLINILLACNNQLFEARQQQFRQRNDFLRAQKKDFISRTAATLLLLAGGALAVYGLVPEDRRQHTAWIGAAVVLTYVVSIIATSYASKLDDETLAGVSEDVQENLHQLSRDERRTEVTTYAMNYFNASVVKDFDALEAHWKDKVKQVYAGLGKEEGDPQWSGARRAEWLELRAWCAGIENAD